MQNATTDDWIKKAAERCAARAWFHHGVLLSAARLKAIIKEEYAKRKDLRAY
jgi:hypothetical protein